MILDYLIIKLYILSIAVVQYELLSCSSLYSILIVQSVWTPYCLSIHSFCPDLFLVLNTVALLSCITIVVRPIVLCSTIGLTCISSVPCTPWSTSSLLITGSPLRSSHMDRKWTKDRTGPCLEVTGLPV